MMTGYGMGFGGGFMWIFWLLLIGFVVWALFGFGSRSEPARSPREVLDRRFAKGEIDESEYRDRRNALEG